MGSEHLSCPGCGGDLVMGQVEGFRQYVCAGCGGVVIGIAVLRQLSGPLGQHIWTAEPVAPSPGTPGTPVTCPFCSTGMTLKAVADRQVPLPVVRAKSCGLTSRPPAPCRSAPPARRAQPTLETQPTLAAQAQAARCQQCGAPVLHTWDERCQYCGAALHAPTQVVVLQSDAPEEENSWDRDATGRHGLFRDVIGMLSRPVD